MQLKEASIKPHVLNSFSAAPQATSLQEVDGLTPLPLELQSSPLHLNPVLFLATR